LLRLVDEAALDELALGAAILGSGGGGNPYIGMLLAKEAIRAGGPVTLVDLDEIDDDALVVPTAMMGAPTIFVEKLPSGDEIVHAFRTLEQYFARPVTHTVSIEAGGINSMIPFSVAAQTGVPVVDADFMGRAFPELQMCLPTLYGISATPMTIADEKGSTVIINTPDNRWTERLARSITIDMGCASMITLYPMSGAQLKQAAAAGTLSLCQELGSTVADHRRNHSNPIDAARERLHGFELFVGKITDVARRTEGGWARAETLVEGTDDYLGSTLLIRTQNEHLAALRDGEMIVTTPDLIIVMDSDTGEPITTEDLRYGFRVTVIAAPCDPRWRTPDGLELVGPRYFGYDVDYLPVEERLATRRRRRAPAATT
jgi:uncharacterized protein